MMTNRFVYAAAEEAATIATYPSMNAKYAAAGYVAVARYDVFALVAEVVSSLNRWYRCRQTVNQISQLDDRLLRDIGLRRGDIRQTADRLSQLGRSAVNLP